jgi:hypothetical protein
MVLTYGITKQIKLLVLADVDHTMTSVLRLILELLEQLKIARIFFVGVLYSNT